MGKITLTEDQVSGIVKLINGEIEANISAGDDAYNTFWENTKMALGYDVDR
jgi:hypothetical protein